MTSGLTSSTAMSVVITCYREGELLREAVNSALKQSPQEIIIVNDASSHESTNKVCHDLESYPSVTVIWRQENGGPSIARNNGFEEAKGDILVPLDADDLLPDNTLNCLADAFGQNREIGFICGAYLRQDLPNQTAETVHPGDISLKTMLSAKRFSLSSCWNLLGTTPLRKSVWQQVGGYDSAFGAQDLHDVEFWIRVIASGCSYVALDQPIYVWRKYLGSNSRQVTPLSWYQISQKYFEIYRSVGLEYRAYELLLLGSKWENDSEKIVFFREKLFQCIRRGNYRFSSLVALAITSRLLRVLVQQAGRRR